MSKHLLPLIPAGLAVVQVLPSSDRITIVARPVARHACCPDCGARPAVSTVATDAGWST